MLKQGKTKKCYALRLKGVAKLDNVGLVVQNDFAFEIRPPISFKDTPELISKLEKELKFPKPKKIKKVSQIFGEDGHASETIEVEIGEKVRLYMDVFYYLD